MNTPEILSPAGDFENLKINFAYGADAVYLSGQNYSLRNFASNFDDEGLKAAVEYAHLLGKKAYVTVNVFPRNSDLPGIEAHLDFLKTIKPDAVILSDLGVLSLAKERCPQIPVHVSVQANNLNHREVKMWHSLGASRVILARELSINEIKEIHEAVPEMELEVFVHGAVCMSYSGRCLLSDYLTGRSANSGECTQSCRWSYKLVEEKRPGEFMEISQDSRGTYIMNSKDLCLINRLREFMEAGVISFKIEGRMKGSHYCAVTAFAYKQALMSALKGEPAPARLYEELLKVSHREYSEGFYFPDAKSMQNPLTSDYSAERRFCGVVESADGLKIKTTKIKHSFRLNDTLDIITPEGAVFDAAVKSIINMEGTEETYAKQGAEYTLELEPCEKITALSILRV